MRFYREARKSEYAGSMANRHVSPSDTQLIQIVDAAAAEVARKSGAWLVCKPGCTPCCHGPFPINQLDVERLRAGLEKLTAAEPQRARAIRERTQASVRRLSRNFPGDAKTGILAEDEAAIERFEDFANDEPCPVLSADGRCELYEHRPMTCRVFGPPLRSGEEGGLGHCELCYHGATPEEIAACELAPQTDELEEQLNQEAERKAGVRGQTIVAFALW